jgi:hypothetical protein
MKKLIFNLFVLAIGLVVFIAAVVNISTPIVLLRPTSEPAIHAEYIAPSVHFMGVVPPLRNGKAHIASSAKADKAQNMRSSSVRKKVTAQGSASHAGEVLFGQFSTAKAMGYHAGPVEYHRRTLTCPLVKEYVK